VTVQPLYPTREAQAPIPVRRWMTPDPVTVTPETSVLVARRLLQTNGVRHLPVVTVAGRVVGMVSDRDLIMRDVQLVQALSALQSELVGGRYRRVETVMSAPARIVAPDEPVGRAADMMLCWGVSSLPVVDHGRLVGIVTTTDCLRALARGNNLEATTSEGASHPPSCGWWG
jgi:acetoin utilization protein AcuB